MELANSALRICQNPRYNDRSPLVNPKQYAISMCNSIGVLVKPFKEDGRRREFLTNQLKSNFFDLVSTATLKFLEDSKVKCDEMRW